MKNSYLLLLIDGFGLAACEAGDAFRLAQTPVLDQLFADCPHTTLAASGKDIGLADGAPGDPAAGLINIGTGRPSPAESTGILPSPLCSVLSSLGLRVARYYTAPARYGASFGFDGFCGELFPGVSDISIPEDSTLPPYQTTCDAAAALTDRLIADIEAEAYDFLIADFSAADRTGLTGILPHTVAAVELLDQCIGRIFHALQRFGTVVILTSPNGNAEKTVLEDGVTPFPARTDHLVPLLVTGADLLLVPGRLCDVAPTILDIMGISPPEVMQGVSLIRRR